MTSGDLSQLICTSWGNLLILLKHVSITSPEPNLELREFTIERNTSPKEKPPLPNGPRFSKMSDRNWGGKRLRSGRKSNWTFSDKIEIGAKCQEIHRKSREKQTLQAYWLAHNFTQQDRENRKTLVDNLLNGDRATISDRLNWINKDLEIGQSYEDIDEWLQCEQSSGDLSRKTYDALQGLIDNREAGYSKVVIDIPLKRGLSRMRICEMSARLFRDNPNISTPSAHSVDRIWKWYRKSILAVTT